MKEILVKFQIPDDCDPSLVDKFIITNNYEIVMSVNGLATEYALELIEKAVFPIDIVKEVWDGEIEETESSVSLHTTAFDYFIIEALKKNPFWKKLTATTPGHYYFSK